MISGFEMPSSDTGRLSCVIHDARGMGSRKWLLVMFKRQKSILQIIEFMSVKIAVKSFEMSSAQQNRIK